MIGVGPLAVSAIVCADWGKEVSKRAVFVADVDERTVRRLGPARWTFEEVLRHAEPWASRGSVLVAFDAPFGVSKSYLSALSRASPQPISSFLELLVATRQMPSFFDATSDPRDWRPERPFFGVPGGEGGRRSYEEVARRFGVEFSRTIDKQTRANPMFIKSGIPGTVGSGTIGLWRELEPLLRPGRTFRLWPFEGELSKLLQQSRIVVGEIYPRAAYATALSDHPVMTRPQMSVAKTEPATRREAIRRLRKAAWICAEGVTLDGLSEAEQNEDDFDACFTAAALLRCVLDGSPLCPSPIESATVEGGILGTGSVNLELPAQVFSSSHKVLPQLPRQSTLAPPQVVSTGRRAADNPVRVTESLEALQERFCEAVRSGRPVIATYSWIYGRAFGSVPIPWSQGHATRISTMAHHTSPRTVPGLGAVALDTFIVSANTRQPSQGYWRAVLHDEQQWQRVLAKAHLLHGTAKAPWD